jgi:hypothetical protein
MNTFPVALCSVATAGFLLSPNLLLPSSAFMLLSRPCQHWLGSFCPLIASTLFCLAVTGWVILSPNCAFALVELRILFCGLEVGGGPQAQSRA